MAKTQNLITADPKRLSTNQQHQEHLGVYQRTVEVFGRTLGYRVTPLSMNGLDGWAVRTESGLMDAWFIHHEHACRWVDAMAERLS